MGDIADSMINGEFDCFSGEYIGKPVGYPRTNQKRSKVKTGNNYQQSNKSRVWGMIFVDGNPHNLSEDQIYMIIEEYVHGELKLPSNVKESTAYKHILSDPKRFEAWYLLKYPHLAKDLNNGRYNNN